MRIFGILLGTAIMTAFGVSPFVAIVVLFLFDHFTHKPSPPKPMVLSTEKFINQLGARAKAERRQQEALGCLFS